MKGTLKTLFPLPLREEVVRQPPEGGKPRLVVPDRDQMEMLTIHLDGLLAPDHQARLVWAYVESLDVGPLYAGILSVEGNSGRRATDPRVMLALWLYATLDGVGSARTLDRLTNESLPYRWICGGVPVNYHSLADFRVKHLEFLDKLLTASVASLLAAGAVHMERVAQDGIRVRAHAGNNSFRRKGTLTRYLEEAERQVEALKKELKDDQGGSKRRVEQARERAARERLERVNRALKRLPAAEAKKAAKDKDKARVSVTDADATIMKMGDGGYQPAYNAQLATDAATQIVIGVDVDTCGNDAGQMPQMVAQLEERYDRVPKEFLVDGGYAKRDDIEQVTTEKQITVYTPVSKPKNHRRDPYKPRPGDSDIIAAWRVRMGTEEAKEIYRQRSWTAEWVNACFRNRGLRQFLVRGKQKVKAVLLWFALAHNLMRGVALGLNAPATV